MKLVRVWFLMLLIVAMVPLAAQGAREVSVPAQEEPFAFVTDSYGREVVIPRQPQRIISLGPNITEMVFALGLGDSLIGRTDFCDYPEAVFSVASVGGIMDPSIERIIDLEPDLVISSAHVGRAVVNSLEQAGIPVVALYADENFEGVFFTIREVGRITGAQDASESIIREMEETFSMISERVSDVPKPRVYYVVGFGEWGDFTAGGDTYINQLIELAGGENIAAGISGWSYSVEKLVEEDPDIILISKFFSMKEQFASSPVYRDLRAVQAGDLYALDTNMIDRQGVRNAQGALSLARIFHPELFGGDVP